MKSLWLARVLVAVVLCGSAARVEAPPILGAIAAGSVGLGLGLGLGPQQDHRAVRVEPLVRF